MIQDFIPARAAAWRGEDEILSSELAKKFPGTGKESRD